MKRIESIDLLRGFAVLGILFMNIQVYSMPDMAFANPTAYGDFTWSNKIIFYLEHIFVDQKFMGIFSMLFGASVALMLSKAESKGLNLASLHYKRTFWLLVFGLLHGILLWSGDILTLYAISSVALFFFRNWQAKNLMITGLILITIGAVITWLFGESMVYWPKEDIAVTLQEWKPNAENLARYFAIYKGPWLEQTIHRFYDVMGWITIVIPLFLIWKTLGLMIIGMALYKWEILAAVKTKKFYIKLMLPSFILGLWLVVYGLYYQTSYNWDMKYSMFQGTVFNYFGSFFLALSYICIVMLLSKSRFLNNFKNTVAAVGKTAFSNYIFQSVICTFIFYGHGLSLYGTLTRLEQLLLVIAISIFQLIVSNLWLKYYRSGPLEWLWRSLIYMKRLTLKR